ncbi:MAG TPA: hypothetical protein VES42_17850 [Pilimelia sp.]|nr:hypothetical protein [Pilimelia sp.]
MTVGILLRARVAQTAVAALIATAGVAVAATPAAGHDAAGRARAIVPAPVAPPRATPPAPLHQLAGTVPVRAATPAAGRARAAGQTATADAGAALAATDRVALRALVIAVDSADFGLPTWRQTLDRVGAPYDVLLSRDTPLTADRLVRPDGTGRYNAILLTSASLLYADGGAFLSGLDATEWNTLWAYERDYAVRQVALYTSHGAWPEDYCLRPVSEGGVGDTPLATRLTTAGAQVFDYLRATAQVPLVQSYVYRTSVAPGCAAQPLITVGAQVLGVTSTSTDGRQRLALTFTTNQHLLHADLLGYGLLRWATRGLLFGEQRHHLNVDVDDWFINSDHRFPDGHIESDPGYQVSASELITLTAQLTGLRQRYPQAAAFRPTMAYNGGGANVNALPWCAVGGPAFLTGATKCFKGQYRWINHTVNHPELNHTDYATTRAQIEENLRIGAALGLPVDASVLKTPEYSGLGVYHPDPNNDTDPPTDFGLAASNPALLQAAADLGVRYLHGNMSFSSHVPSCFNCAVPLPQQPAVSIVPDWPTNIAYHTTTPAEETSFYNSFYGPNGRFPFWPRDLTYAELLSYETDLALRHMTSGSVYTHTFHIANVHDYGAWRTLLTDWLDSVLRKFTTYYRVPVLSPTWPALGRYATARTAHFGLLAAGADAVYDRVAGTVTVTSPRAGTVTMTGARTAGFSTYGTDVSAPVTVAAGTPLVFTPVVRA